MDKQLKDEVNWCKQSIQNYYKDIEFNQQVLDEYVPLLDNPTKLLNHWSKSQTPYQLEGLMLGPDFKRIILLEIKRQYALKYLESNQIISIDSSLAISKSLSFGDCNLYINGNPTGFLTSIQDTNRVLLVVLVNFVEIDKAIKTPQIKAIIKIIGMINDPTRVFDAVWYSIKEYNRKYESCLANSWVTKYKIKKELDKPNGYLVLKQGLNNLLMRLGYYGKPSIDSRLGKTKQLKKDYLEQLNYLFNDVLKLNIPVEVKFIASF